jgi:hypothetical protein
VTDLESAIEREVIPGATTLGALGALIDAPSWLDDGVVTVVEAVGGKLPVSWPPGGTVATVALPGGRAVLYLALDEAFTAADVAAGLRNAPGAERASGAVVRELAVVHGG